MACVCYGGIILESVHILLLDGIWRCSSPLVFSRESLIL